MADLTLASPKVVAHTDQLWFQDLNYQHGHSVCVTRDTVTYNPEKLSSLRLVTLHVVRYGHFEIYHHSVETRQHNGRGIATSSAICSLHNKQLTIVLLGHSRKTHSMFSAHPVSKRRNRERERSSASSSAGHELLFPKGLRGRFPGRSSTAASHRSREPLPTSRERRELLLPLSRE